MRALMLSVDSLGAPADVAPVRSLLESLRAIHETCWSSLTVGAPRRKYDGRCLSAPTYFTSFVISGESIPALHPTGGPDLSALLSLLMVLDVMTWLVAGAHLTASGVDLVAEGTALPATKGCTVGCDLCQCSGAYGCDGRIATFTDIASI